MSIDPRSLDPRAFGAVETVVDDDKAQTLAEDCARAMWKGDAASQALGMRIDEVGPGRAVLVMTVRPDMLNGHQTCHGGFIFALADSAFAFACNSYDRATVAAGCSIEYLAPARAGELLRAEAVERSRSGRTGVYDITVSGEDGRSVALFRGKSHEIKGPVIGA
ncbi:hydroxyphenylacetyl-CoA thioesterase PaaI [uncultured Methylibium sp.]|uniref:hydroxyphenylacetyl-CoA thioesterase PaaI n=1 Tax=uncultured Methylibium sp. TaxID=381093 RepID=UPI0025F544BB|nr:hydroxyphenylacetyl-CoA thioesterase PaaI [uncultured Methylibium sp.]